MIRRDVLAALRYRDCGLAGGLRPRAGGSSRPANRLGMVPRRLLAWRDSPERLTAGIPRTRRSASSRARAAFLADGFPRRSRRLRAVGARRHRPRAPARARGATGKRPVARRRGCTRAASGTAIAGAPVVCPGRARRRAARAARRVGRGRPRRAGSSARFSRSSGGPRCATTSSPREAQNRQEPVVADRAEADRRVRALRGEMSSPVKRIATRRRPRRRPPRAVPADCGPAPSRASGATGGVKTPRRSAPRPAAAH